MAKSVTDATSKVHAILEPLAPDDRQRVVRAALILLGDSADLPSARGTSGNGGGDGDKSDEPDSGDLPKAAQRWMRKHKLSVESLEHYFHFDDGNVKPIELAGNVRSKRQKTVHAYLMQGVAALLQSGTPAFSDDDARAQCREFGCYDQANHSKCLRDFGNQITGSKSKGWKLTAPGLDAAAKLLSNGG